MVTEAKVIITGQNRVGAAVKSAANDLNQLGRQAQSLQKIFASAFALTGVFAFGRAVSSAIDATKRFDTTFARRIDEVHASFSNLLAVKGGLPEINEQLDNLAKTLQDPSIVAGADAFFGSLLRGAIATAEAIAKIAGGLRSLGVNAGIFDPKTQQEQIDALDKEIDAARKVRALSMSYGQDVSKIDADIASLRAKQQKVIDAGPTAADKPTDIDKFRDQQLKSQFDSLQPIDLNPMEGSKAQAKADYFKFLKGLDDEAKRTKVKLDDLTEIDLNPMEGSIAQATKEYQDFLNSISTTNVFAEQAARDMQDAFAQFLFDPFHDGVKGMLRSFVDIVRRMVAEATAAALFEKLFGGASGKGKGVSTGLGGLLSSILGAFGGGKAEGGPLQSNRWYIAGEHGPEPVWGGGSGAFAMGYGGSGSSINIVNHIDARGATTDFIQQLPGVLRANNDAVKADLLETMSRRPPPSFRR